jgi:hypothetical protein
MKEALMSEVFRKHYSYGEIIPVLDTFVGMTCDLYEVTDKTSPAGGPYVKAVFSASAGPMKSLPMIVEPLQDNDSKIVNLANIPVPIPSVRTVDVSLIFDLVGYRWTPSQEMPRDNGLITFDLRLRAAFSLLGKSYTMHLDRRPCSLTLLNQLEGVFTEQRERATTTTSGKSEERTSTQTIDGRADEFTGQLDIEERLRQLSANLLVRQ